MDALNRYGRMPGGLALPAFKEDSTQNLLRDAPLPQRLIVPLEEGVSIRGVTPAVKTGQRVLRGQPLVTGGGPLATWAHASTSGIVRALETHPLGHPRRPHALCAVLEADGEDEWWPPLAKPDPARWDSPHKLATALSRAGLAGLGGAVFPTGLKLAGSQRQPLHAVIVNGAECEPYISCDDMLMRSSPREVLAGALALLAIAGAGFAYVVLEEDKPQALAALEQAFLDLGSPERLTLLTVPTRYPAGGERQLVQVVAGHEVPSGGFPTDIGYLCQNVGTAVALYRFLRSGEPLTQRVTTVTGGAVAQPGNWRARLGTPIADLLNASGGCHEPVHRLILGGGMMGVALDGDEIPLTRAANCIVAATAEEIRSPQTLPCIRCGECSDACPASLMPQLLHREAQQGRHAQLESLSLFDCIECGCCDVVCPSHIPLTESFRQAKQNLLRAMDDDARTLWIDARQQARHARIQRWKEANADRASLPPPPSTQARAAAIEEILDKYHNLVIHT